MGKFTKFMSQDRVVLKKEMAKVYDWFMDTLVNVKKLKDPAYCEFMKERNSRMPRPILPLTVEKARLNLIAAEEKLNTLLQKSKHLDATPME